VEKRKEKEEQQKNLIFNIFLKCQSELPSDRQQVHFSQLCEQIFKWHRDYLSGSIDNVGVEIVVVIRRIIKNGKITGILKDKEDFFHYIKTALRNEKAASHRKYESGIIKMSKEQKAKLKATEDLIRMQESNLGRKLTGEKRSLCISKWFKNHEYVSIKKAMNLGGLSTRTDDSNERDLLNFAATNLTTGSSFNSPIDEYIYNENKKEIIEAAQFLLNKKQERSRHCYKSLFTLYCIEKLKDFEFLHPVLDHKILKTWKKDGIKPKQYDIYKKYHPNAMKNSAEAIASKMSREFLEDLEARLKEKVQ
jgi:hypothetical protein